MKTKEILADKELIKDFQEENKIQDKNGSLEELDKFKMDWMKFYSPTVLSLTDVFFYQALRHYFERLDYPKEIREFLN